MASSNSVTLFSSVILGIAVYGETLAKGGTGTRGIRRHRPRRSPWSGIALLAGSEAPQETATGTANPSPRHVTRIRRLPTGTRPRMP